MDPKDIRELIKAIGSSDITEVELESDGLKLRIRKHVGEPSQTVTRHQPVSVVTETEEEIPSVDHLQDGEDLITIVAPMVGTFYRSPSPTSEPFVTEGELVRIGQSLCIIEAMKLMNEIESEYNGKLVKVLVDNGQPVEYGQSLFLLEPLE